MTEQLKLDINRPAWHSVDYRFVPRAKHGERRVLKERDGSTERSLLNTRESMAAPISATDKQNLST